MLRLRDRVASTTTGIALTDAEILAQVLKGKQCRHIPGRSKRVAGVGSSSFFGSQARGTSSASYLQLKTDELMKKHAEEVKTAKEAGQRAQDQLNRTQDQVNQMVAILSSQPGLSALGHMFPSSSGDDDGNNDGDGNWDGE